MAFTYSFLLGYKTYHMEDKICVNNGFETPQNSKFIHPEEETVLTVAVVKSHKTFIKVVSN